MNSHTITITLPDWAKQEWKKAEAIRFKTDIEKMEFVLSLAKENIQHKTGGPFAAAVFETKTGKLISVGVNVVVESKTSIAHAEIVALALAQQRLHTFSLGNTKEKFELVTSSEPCAMCFGAIPWSGIHRLVIAAKASAAEAIGFDEGPKPKTWKKALEKRGIMVKTGVLEKEASRLLKTYPNSGGQIYNGRS